MSSITHFRLTHYHPSSRSAGVGSMSLLARAVSTLRLWRKRMREKRALEQLDERDLHDIGVSYSDVYSELRRPFWRAPPPAV
jgi:uncharacterized protein YjiS (DUF1127 family)